MKYKKGLIIICLIICLFTIASISAVDVADAAVQADNVTTDEIISSSEEIEIQDGAGAIASDEQDGQNELAISDENNLSIGRHSFDELQYLIDDTPENYELNLSYDYSIAYGGDTLLISKNITINGNQHTLDGANMRRIINIRTEHCEITFKNITFTNGGNINIFGTYTDLDGGAILNKFESNKLNIFYCTFDHNYALEYGGAINTRGQLNITGSTFRKNAVQFGNGGAVYCTNRVTIYDSVFDGNENIKNINPFSTIFSEDIMLPLSGIASDGYYFYGEHIIKWEGLIKFMEKLASLFTDPLNDNGLPMTGGAVYCKGDCTVYNSKFTGNTVGINDKQVATSGGAIHCQGNLHIYNTEFRDNEVNDWGGGAVFVEKNCYVHNSTFEDNKANKGCAIYCWGETRVYNSKFKANNHEEGTTWMEAYELPKKIISWIDKIGLTKWINIPLPTITLFSSDGGAIWSQGECYIESCQFEGNSVCEQGGAIYAKNKLTITGDENIFHNNQVNALTPRNIFEKDGGVIFCKGHLDMKNSWLYNNMATMYGGTIYCEGTSEIRNCTFDNNLALLSGGAIYCEKESNIFDCTFNKNEATFNGGAAYYQNTANIHNCSFNKNTAELGGGAVYFMGKTNAKSAVIDCEFNNNGAKNGGAIRSCGGKLTISGKNKFKNNHASSDGGAIYTSNKDEDEDEEKIETQEGSLTISDCPFDNNRAGKKGGAIYSDNSINFNNCNFNSNIGDSGGAIYLNSKKELTYTMKNCSFNSNKARDGGAIYAIILKKISNLTFKQNVATSGDGGAIYVHKHCNLEITSCAFEENKCGKKGGAVHMDGYTGNLKISHSTFNENEAGKDGGAIYTNYFGTSFTSTEVNDVNFTSNTAKDSGGAIYTSTISKISESNFIKNEATSGDGGAIYTNNHCDAEITSCTFEKNKCGKKGGAVHMDGYTGNLKLSHSTFNENKAGKSGGAIYTNYFGTSHSSTEVNDVNFTSNTAKDGGAMYIATITKVSNANFIQNKATSGSGGAVYICCKCNPEFNSDRFQENTCTNNGGAIYVETIYFHLRSFGCEFTKNHADKSGGAIHAHGGIEKSEVGIKDSSFTNNTAKKDGGAVYASKISEILRSSFKENKVNEGSGGAVFMDWNNNPNINSCTFEKNSAHNSGGAINSASKMDNIKVSDSTFIGNHADSYGGSIYTDCNLVMHSKLEVVNCRFSENYAHQGGAIYTGNLKSATKSVFIKNKATNGKGKEDGDGGAIYIYNKGSIDIISCRFENNNAYNRGGAIYIDSYEDSTKLKVSYTTFVKNNAENKKYKGKKGGGNSIYNNGYYTLLEMLWMGKNNPVFNGQFLEGHRPIVFVKPADTPHTPSSWLNIELDINETNIHANTPYKATIHFYANNGKALQKDLLHSNGYFNGDVNVTNLKANINDVTANIVFTKNKSTIYGHVDDQTVSKTVQVSDLLTAINPTEYLLGEGEDTEFEPQLGPSDFNATIKDFIDLEDENDQVVVSYVVPQDADGKINVYVDYMDIPSYSKETVAGQSVNITSANLNIINPGKYNIRIEYVPNSGDSFNIEEFTMKAHIYTEQDFSISYHPWITSKNENIVSHFSYPVLGTLVFYINGTRRYTEEFEELHEHAYLHLSDLKIVEDGEYNISASYVIKTTLKEISFAQKTIEVDGVDWDADEYVTIFSYVDILDRKDYFIEIENNGDYINGTVSVYIDNTLKLKKSISPADKKVFYDITADDLGIYNNIALGNHTLKVIYMKDNNETHEVEKSAEFYAEPVFVDVFEISVGEKDVLKVTYLKGCKGTATLYNAMINQTEDSSHLMKGSVYKSANFVNGVATIPFDSMAEGEHIFILNITGYDHEASISVTVKRNSPEFSARVSASEVIVGNSVVVKFSGPQSGDFAFIILDDETYKIDSLENGTLSETITGLAVGTHRIKILYDNGTNFYSNTFYVTVKKVPTPAPQPAKKKVIKLTLKKVKVKKSAKKLVLKATLKINGKAVKGKKIIFKFKGKKYKAKTNKKGIAKVTIKKKVLKKLKVGKKIKYLAKYGKITKKYIVKVKK